MAKRKFDPAFLERQTTQLDDEDFIEPKRKPKPKKKSNFFAWLIVGVCVLPMAFCFVGMISPKREKVAAKKEQPAAPKISKQEQLAINVIAKQTPEQKAKRKAAVEEMVKEGTIEDLRVSTNSAHVSVDYRWRALSFKEKEAFGMALMMFIWESNTKVDLLVFHDRQTDARIADFSTLFGPKLNLYK